VGGGDDLEVEAKSCLLRAARAELRKLRAERYRLTLLPTRYAGGPIAATDSEIDCLSKGISWLFNYPAH
jgi:hypothetical protein